MAMDDTTPPSYESAVQPHGDVKDNKAGEPQPALPIAQQPGPSHAVMVDGSAGQAPLHFYQNPWTGEQVASFLPPDHPEMVCLQEGRHLTKNSFGIVGVLAAVFWFPLGIALCMLDRRVKCTRCGRVLEDGITCG
ncbi:hypothetical protein AURDEDRAFT_111162 [Auricularia subglabra TFB-10046 SS5]|nr:hypothetical protein AURDEDRAFT_111162 [Auricularia subglabra TFB-10046 SS5]